MTLHEEKLMQETIASMAVNIDAMKGKMIQLTEANKHKMIAALDSARANCILLLDDPSNSEAWKKILRDDMRSCKALIRVLESLREI